MGGVKEISTIYVFYGKKVDANEQAKLINKIFTMQEVETFDENIKIEFIDERIYSDDTIDEIYMKIQNQIKAEASFEELYMYVESKHIFRSEKVFAALTDNGKKELQKFDFEVFLSNTNISKQNEMYLFKELLSLEDLLSLDLDGKELIVQVQPGNRNWVLPFVVDPYKYTEFFESTETVSSDKNNTQVLLETGSIAGNKLFLVLARDLLRENGEEIDEDLLLEVYYSGLVQEKTKSSLEHVITPERKNYFDVVDLFHEVFYYKTTNLTYNQKGIRLLEASMVSSTAWKTALVTQFILRISS
jgi:hypothetical protein